MSDKPNSNEGPKHRRKFLKKIGTVAIAAAASSNLFALASQRIENSGASMGRGGMSVVTLTRTFTKTLDPTQTHSYYIQIMACGRVVSSRIYDNTYTTSFTASGPPPATITATHHVTSNGTVVRRSTSTGFGVICVTETLSISPTLVTATGSVTASVSCPTNTTTTTLPNKAGAQSASDLPAIFQDSFFSTENGWSQEFANRAGRKPSFQ